MSVSDASGLMPPKSKTHAWFGITSTPEGGRNNLKADNDWLLALTTREMHTANLQSVRDEVKIKAEQEAETRKKLFEDEKRALLRIETARSLMEKLKKQQADLEKTGAELEAERKKLDREKSKLDAERKKPAEGLPRLKAAPAAGKAQPGATKKEDRTRTAVQSAGEQPPTKAGGNRQTAPEKTK